MSAPVSRRDRLREQTVVEIKAAARRRLVEEGPAGISLRAIAREMGMTAPGLYRYYGSLEELVGALTVDFYDELVAKMERAGDALPEEDLGGRLLAVSRAFRSWSVAHPGEFGLIFGRPRPTLERAPEGAASVASTRFGAVFREIFTGLWQSGSLRLPAESDLNPRLRRQLRAYAARVGGTLPPAAYYVFAACWVRIYGSVAMEVFGKLKWAFEEGGALFESELQQLAGFVGLPGGYRPPADSSRSATGGGA